MNATLYVMELKRNLKSTIIWLAVIVVCVVSTLAIVPNFMNNQEGLREMLAAYPESTLKAFNFDLENFGDSLGAYATYYGFFFPMLGAIFAISMGSKIVAKEEGKKTAEFLFTRPITRVEAAKTKMAVLFTYVTLIWILTSLVEHFGLPMISAEAYNRAAYWTMSFYAYLMILCFGFLGMVVSAL